MPPNFRHSKNQFIDFLKTEDYSLSPKTANQNTPTIVTTMIRFQSNHGKIIENYKDTAKTITDAILLYAYDNNWFDYHYQNQHHQSVLSFYYKDRP